MKRLFILSLALLAAKSAFAADAQRPQPSAPNPHVLEFPLSSLIQLRHDEFAMMKEFLQSTINNKDAADNLYGIPRERAEELIEETEKIMREAHSKIEFANEKKEHTAFLEDHERSRYETNQDIVLRLFVKHLDTKMSELTGRASALVAYHTCMAMRNLSLKRKREAEKQKVIAQPSKEPRNEAESKKWDHSPSAGIE